MSTIESTPVVRSSSPRLKRALTSYSSAASARRRTADDARAPADKDDERRRSSIFDNLLSEARKLSVALGGRTSADTGSDLAQGFEELVGRLVKDKTHDIAAAKELTERWYEETFECSDEKEQLRRLKQFVVEVLPPHLVGHVKVKESASIWDALMTIRTVLLTWGDSVSDYYAAALLVRRSP